MRLISAGEPAKAAAFHMGVSRRTIENIKRNVRRKLGAPTTAAAAAMLGGMFVVEQPVPVDVGGAAKLAARQVVRDAVFSGRLAKPTICSMCAGSPGRQHIHAHHDDYREPLAVVWLCKSCHRERHRGMSGPFALLRISTRPT